MSFRRAGARAVARESGDEVEHEAPGRARRGRSRSGSRTGALRAVLVSSIALWIAGAASSEGLIPAPLTPVQLAIAGGQSQLFRSDVPVYGLRTSLLFGMQDAAVHGIDVGLLHTARSGVALSLGAYNGISRGGGGLQVGVVNRIGEAYGGSHVAVLNIVEGDLWGSQLGAVNHVVGGAGAQLGLLNRSTSLAALQLGAWNLNSQDYDGAQTAVVNLVGGRMRGTQIGAVNRADRGVGLQLGLLNLSDSMKGLQIGILNGNRDGLLPWLPFFNVGL